MQDQGPFRLHRQEHPVQFFQNLLAGIIHVHVPGELQDHIADAGAADAADLDQSTDDPEGFFYRAADVRLDLLGSRTRVIGAYGQRRVTQLRHQHQRQPAVTEPAEHHRRQEDHEDRHRP